MEVGAGYKQTVIGAIPEDWDVRALEQVFALKHGVAFSSEHFSNTGPIVLTPGNFSLEGGLYFEDRNTKRYSGNYSPNMAFRKGDLLIVMTDLTPTCNLLGKPAFVDTDDVILHNQRIGKVLQKDKSVHLPFLYYVLLSRPYLDHIRGQAFGSTVRHTSSKSIYRAQVAVPPPPEQRAIATALNDVDALLDRLTRLIAKKRDLKQAAMQQLLTGQTRLPGFREEWELKPIGSVAPLQRGFDLPTRDLTPGPFPVVYSNGIEAFHNKFMVKGPGVVTGRSGTLGRVHYVETNFWPHNTSLWVTRFGDNVPKFIYYLYCALGFERFSSGSGVPTLNRNDAHTHEIAIPPDPDEQRAISAVLTDMDADLCAVEARRDKTRALKQAMMQELLTGKTRLVPAAEAYA